MFSKADRPHTIRVVGICSFLTLLVLVVFGQTVRFGFVNYDDPMYVSQNPIVQRGLTWNGVLWAFTYDRIGHWHPLTWLTHMADCQMYGLWAGGHHLTNLLLHAVTTVLLFLLLREMTGKLWRCAFVAAVFAVHPLRAESVAWIAERKDVLSGMFFMLTLWAYVAYVRRPSCARYVAVVLLYVLGLLSKDMLVTLPFVLLLLDWWPLGRMKGCGLAQMNPDENPGIPFWGLVKEKIPLLLLSLISCVVTILAPEHMENIDRLSFLARAGNALVCYVIYLRQMVFPAGLAIPYPNAPDGPPKWEVCQSLVVLTVITVSAVASQKRRPFLLMGWLWYLGMLVPVIGLVQISYYSHADRYTYLPEIGLAIAGTWAVADWTKGWPHRRMALGGLMTMVIGSLTVCGFIQTSYWRDSETLWRHTLACMPSNVVAHNNLGNALVQNGNLEEGIVEFRKALDINPRDVGAHNNLGTALVQMGDLNAGMAEFQKSLALNPEDAEACNNLGNALIRKGNVERAIAEFQKALALNPEDAEACNNLGNALTARGDLKQAIAQYRKAIEINPDYEDAHYNLGEALFKTGEIAAAAAQYSAALKIRPDDADARTKLGNALARQGNWEGAILEYRKAVALQPNLASAQYSLGHALLKMGDFNGAMACFQKTTGLGADALTRWCNLGDSFFQQKDWPDAISCFRQATKSNPRSAVAYVKLGLACFKGGQVKEAIGSWQQALEINPNQLYVQNNLAWVLATTPDTSLRDGAKAVTLATRANQLTGGGNPIILRTLAAAYAETGDYGLATATARRGLELAVAHKDDPLAAVLKKDIRLYEASAPVREAQ